MMIRSILSCALMAMLVCPLEAGFSLKKIASGFQKPVWVGCPPGARNFLWVGEQGGPIRVVEIASGEIRPTPFLDLTGIALNKGNEQGFLGLAFAPDFMESGRFYVNYTDTKGKTHVSRFTVGKDKRLEADAGQEERILSVDQPFANHNGGWVGFGPDRMLYIGLGDGGSANDPQDNGQKLSTHLGKILRIDVSTATGYRVPPDNPLVGKPDAKPEIWMWGLRNPWRCSFDRKTGDMWIGDVGQNRLEEVDFVPAGKGAGWNFGWRPREGSISTPSGGIGGPKPEGAVDPIFEYPHENGPVAGFSITGGCVYRGPLPSLQGLYFVADYQLPRLWSFKQVDGKLAGVETWSDKLGEAGIRNISSFGEDNEGNLYLTDHAGGSVWMIDR